MMEYTGRRGVEEAWSPFLMCPWNALTPPSHPPPTHPFKKRAYTSLPWAGPGTHLEEFLFSLHVAGSCHNRFVTFYFLFHDKMETECPQEKKCLACQADWRSGDRGIPMWGLSAIICCHNRWFYSIHVPPQCIYIYFWMIYCTKNTSIHLHTKVAFGVVPVVMNDDVDSVLIKD